MLQENLEARHVTVPSLKDAPQKGSVAMTEELGPVNCDAPATLFKWPTPAKRKLADGETIGAQSIFNGTLEGCVKQFLLKPLSQRSLFKIFTDLQPGLKDTILRSDQILELAERIEFPRD
jgi:hypothetical protein